MSKSKAEERLEAEIAALAGAEKTSVDDAGKPADPPSDAGRTAETAPEAKPAGTQEVKKEEPLAQDEQPALPTSVPFEDFKRLKDKLAGTDGNNKQLKQKLSELERSNTELAALVKALQSSTEKSNKESKVEPSALEDMSSLYELFGGEEAAKPLLKILNSYKEKIASLESQLGKVHDTVKTDYQKMQAMSEEDKFIKSLSFSLDDLANDSEFVDWARTETNEYGDEWLSVIDKMVNRRNKDGVSSVIGKYLSYLERTGQAVPASLKHLKPQQQKPKADLSAETIPSRAGTAPAQPAQKAEMAAPEDAEALEAMISKALDDVTQYGVHGERRVSKLKYEQAKELLHKHGMG